VRFELGIYWEMTWDWVRTFPRAAYDDLEPPSGGMMSRLIRMDQTGHTTLAAWNVQDTEAVQAARVAFQEQLEAGYFAVVSRGEGHAEQVHELPLDEPLVILRRPIAGG
jgi:hypothetical protein